MVNKTHTCKQSHLNQLQLQHTSNKTVLTSVLIIRAQKKVSRKETCMISSTCNFDYSFPR
uniref:Uncharacterized protein n=1 Tax=Arundo donax TaxID=35708 RepID=A0A0A9EHI0_ARUDO